MCLSLNIANVSTMLNWNDGEDGKQREKTDMAY